MGLLILVFAAGSCLARDYSLWGGQATFSLPKGATVKKENEGEFFVYPKGSDPKRTKAFAVVVREQAPSLRGLAEMRLRDFKKAGLRVTNFRVDVKRARVSMNVAGPFKGPVMPLDFKDRKPEVRARYVAFRAGSHVINAIAVSERRTWNSKTSKAYRRVVDSLRVRR
jgi:hypothetical protein